MFVRLASYDRTIINKQKSSSNICLPTPSYFTRKIEQSIKLGYINCLQKDLGS